MSIWFIMPVLNMGRWWRLAGECIKRPTHCLLIPFFYIGKLLLAYAISSLCVYLLFPFMDISLGFKNLFCHASFKEDDAYDYSDMPAQKLFEQIGEAVPQFTIAVTFYSLNWHWLSPWDRGMGVGTMTLSAGSILMGVVKGGMIVREKGGWKSFLTKDGNFTRTGLFF